MSYKLATGSYAKQIGGSGDNTNKLVKYSSIADYGCRLTDNPTKEYDQNEIVRRKDLAKIITRNSVSYYPIGYAGTTSNISIVPAKYDNYEGSQSISIYSPTSSYENKFLWVKRDIGSALTNNLCCAPFNQELSATTWQTVQEAECNESAYGIGLVENYDNYVFVEGNVDELNGKDGWDMIVKLQNGGSGKPIVMIEDHNPSVYWEIPVASTIIALVNSKKHYSFGNYDVKFSCGGSYIEKMLADGCYKFVKNGAFITVEISDKTPNPGSGNNPGGTDEYWNVVINNNYYQEIGITIGDEDKTLNKFATRTISVPKDSPYMIAFEIPNSCSLCDKNGNEITNGDVYQNTIFNIDNTNNKLCSFIPGGDLEISINV